MTSHKKLTLYVNPLWRRSGIHSALMNQWWGNPYGDTSLFTKQLFDNYVFNTELYAITDDIKNADLVFPPYPHVWYLRHDKNLFNECIKTAHESKLPLLIDGTGDVEYKIDAQNAYILRYGGYRFINETGRIQIPLYADDLLERCRGGDLKIRKKSENIPTIGFAGWVNLSVQQHIKTIIKELPIRFRSLFNSKYQACIKGTLWRIKTLRILKRSNLINLNLRARSTFSGSSKTADVDLVMLREQMVETILNSDYALDIKGDANNSARLFEILSLGRIPIIIDTERNLPFRDKIDYSSFSLIVDYRDIKKLPEIITSFHKNISPQQYEQMQRNARNAFLNYFRVDACMPLIVEELRHAKTI